MTTEILRPTSCDTSLCQYNGQVLNPGYAYDANDSTAATFQATAQNDFVSGIFSGFSAPAHAHTARSLVIWAPSSTSYRCDLSSPYTVRYSLDAGSTWADVFSSDVFQGNDLCSTTDISTSADLSQLQVQISYGYGNAFDVAEIGVEGTYTTTTNNHAKKSALAMSGH